MKTRNEKSLSELILERDFWYNGLKCILDRLRRRLGKLGKRRQLRRTPMGMIGTGSRSSRATA